MERSKISKVSHKEAIYGLSHQILSKSKTEGRRRLSVYDSRYIVLH